MTQPLVPSQSTTLADAYPQAFAAGRRAGLATAAIALSLVAFFSLLGAEKAILAIALAVLARRGAERGSTTRRLTTAAIAIASVFLISMAFILIRFWNELIDILNHLRQLS